jgi:hypothetical protein
VHRPLPKDVDFPKLEEQVLERWREHDVYSESLRRREGAPPFVFYEGPHRHARDAKAKARAKTRAQTQARKAHRKR